VFVIYLSIMNLSELVQKFEDAGQGHVFRFFTKLNETEKTALLQQATEINLAEISSLSLEWQETGLLSEDYSDLAPAPYIQHPASGGDESFWGQASALGEEGLRKGRVAAFTVAGGQGTRLGYNGPKGTFPSTPVKGKSLFQVFSEKIRASSDRYGNVIEWLIMTSIQNDAETRAFFKVHDFFGLNCRHVHFFTQGLMPAVDTSGKILMSSKGRIAMSPDGHGGSLRALVRSGHVQRLLSKGVDTISYFQVDNPLVQCIDPAFIGFHIKERAEISSKMVQKAYASERVGHFCVQNEKQVVIEYSDLPKELQEKLHPETGELLYPAGSIAIHILDLNFIARVGGGNDPALALPFHFAQKKVSCIDAAGSLFSPLEPNGIKFEMFIFDSLPLAKRSVIIETRREDEFSPIKNASGQDSVTTSKRDQSAQHIRWLKTAGEDVNDLETIEISPFCAQTESEFIKYWQALDPKPLLKDGMYLNLNDNLCSKQRL